MSKPQLKVAFIDFWPEWNDENFILPILESKYDIIIDENKPDVIFYSIFDEKVHKYKKAKKFLYIAENVKNPIYPSHIRDRINKAFKIADYTITFNPHSDTNFRLPLWQAFILGKPEYWNKLINRVNYNKFDRFCSFTVSNPSNFIRNGFYQQLNNYKRVHSYGKYMTNSPELQKFASKFKYWRDAKDVFFNEIKHKFTITFENTSYPYYCTEKLMDGFLVGSMPIYWGDPKVKQDWNGAAFLNYNDYKSSIIQVIKKMDQDYEVFEAKYHAPVFTEEQKDKHWNNLEGFKEWLIKKIK